ncbi:YbaB/EbfC family nucleoid-associated protein [Microbispora hainanensis]|jgi:DNA-binding protein YbaB|uniref:YbaB/EbfC family nucleoid-associated protein n=1 Tax=Microbispora hainanensis TaxID=568844 RepID=A0ABZ1SM89_9ACTN|nr:MULTISPECIES: YbaB/EbfC family nucleoid-associated protein [Microbispora]NJP29345.1 YbaB/EbfC family nucleoid-associated protein [Microbispora sp. CL1-1]TQS05426.1 YbaB/EbfC family nucleoid-associated protein [Microbispora sp. SCL1-1]
MADLLSGDPEFDRIKAEFQATSRELSDVMNRIGEVVGEATSRDEKIRVRVSGSGQLIGLRIDPRAMRTGSQELADTIMETSRRAVEDAERKLLEVARPYFGEERAQEDRRRFT